MTGAQYDDKYQIIIDLKVNWRVLFLNSDYHLLTPIGISIKNNEYVLNVNAAPYVIFCIDVNLILRVVNNFVCYIKISKINIITSMS
jgi:hypothetical protein